MAFDLTKVTRQFPGRLILWYPQLPSTMSEAARWAAEGCAAGTIIGADEQTAGQGRLGRSWHSEPESGLYVSFVLRPKVAADLPVLTLAMGLAAAEAIRLTTDLAVDLRWPNDVLLGGRKCAGILAQWQDGALIAGIGVNVNHGAFPEGLQAMATSLRIASGRIYSREDLLLQLAVSVDTFCTMWEVEGKQPILSLFARQSSYVSGRRVQVEQGNGILHGTTEGLDPSGFLWLRDENGHRSLICAGGIRPA